MSLEEVQRAMASLEADGQTPTIRAIKRTLGTGSSDRITTLRQVVLGQRALEQGAPTGGTPLDAVLKIAVDFVGQLAGEAAAANVELVEGIRREADEAVRAADERGARAEAAADAGALERERALGSVDTLASQVRELEEALDAESARLADVEGERDAFREAAAWDRIVTARSEEDVRAQAAEHERRLERRDVALAEEREGRRTSEQEATRASTALELVSLERDRASAALEALTTRTAERDAALERVAAHRQAFARSLRTGRRLGADARRHREGEASARQQLADALACVDSLTRALETRKADAEDAQPPTGNDPAGIAS